MTTSAERAFAEGVAAWTPPWARGPEPEAERTDPSDSDPSASDSGSAPSDTAASDAVPAGARRKRSSTAPAAEPPPTAEPIDPDELRPAVEAILLIVDEPVTEIVLAQVLDQTTEMMTQVLEELAAEYTTQRRGFELRRAAGGWRLYTRGDFAPYVEKFMVDGQQTKLTQAALETLAVVAYKQPVTRGRISAIRGVNCDGVLRTLLSRGLVEECGSDPDSGAYLYRTTILFLEKLGIDSPDELPSLAPFLPDDVDALADAQ